MSYYYSHNTLLAKELEKYDVPCGHTNYAACYATGLLLARRALDIVGLADTCVGVEEVDAEEFHIEEITRFLYIMRGKSQFRFFQRKGLV